MLVSSLIFVVCLLTQFHVIRPKKLPPKFYQLLMKND